jgi:hypothetical protein
LKKKSNINIMHLAKSAQELELVLDQVKLCALPVEELDKLLLIKALLALGEHVQLAEGAELKLKNPAFHVTEMAD